MKKFFQDISISFLGCIISAFGTACFLLPNKLSSGGFSGIATILYYLFNIKMGVSILILNIPLFILAYIKLGKYFVAKTVISTIAYSKMIDFFEMITLNIQDKFLASIYGGILIGIGLSFVFRRHASTGGTDLIASLTQSYNPRIKIGQMLVLLDFFIVFANLIVFKSVEIGLYSFIAIFLESKAIDIIFEGVNFTKLIYIISNKSEEISNQINIELEKGATLLYGKGSYKKNDKYVIMCATKRTNVIKVKRLVYNIDENAFLIITDAREVYGLGFKNG
jgi:uncharacterized membrane-anchored protein YitT (DUF2179 family)